MLSLLFCLFPLYYALLPTYFEPQTPCPPQGDIPGYFGREIGSLHINLKDWDGLMNATADEKNYVKLQYFNYKGNGWNQTFTSGIQMRIRGRAAQIFPKKSFTLKFKNNTVSKIQLKAEASDPSFIREHLVCDFQYAFGYCPQQKGFTKLWINGTYWGLYTLMENFDEDFFSVRDSSVGLLYKLNMNDLRYMGDPYQIYPQDAQKTLEKTMPTLVPIQNLAKTLATFESEQQIEAVLDVYALLKSLALEVATRDWDNYWLKANNYYIYLNMTSGKLKYIGYDYDLTFGSAIPQGESQADFFYNISALDYSTTPFAKYYQRPLINNILRFDKFRNYYYWCLSLASGLLGSSEFQNHARELQARIASSIDEGNGTMSVWKKGTFAESLTTPGTLVPTLPIPGFDFYGMFPFNQKWAQNMTAQLQQKAQYDQPVITKIYVKPVVQGMKKDPAYLYAHVEHHFSSSAIKVVANITIFDWFEGIPWSKTISIPMRHVSNLGYTNFYELDLNAQSLPNWNYIAYGVFTTHPNGIDKVVSPPDYPKSWGLVVRT